MSESVQAVGNDNNHQFTPQSVTEYSYDAHFKNVMLAKGNNIWGFPPGTQSTTAGFQA